MTTGGFQVTKALKNSARNGKKLVNFSGDPVVNEDPGTLAKMAGVDIQAFTLATVISSEHGSESNEVQQAVAWAVLNEAKRRGKSVFDVVTAGKFPGRYARQSVGGRYVATMSPPYQRHLINARMVLSGKIGDPLKGGTKFFSPKTQDILNKRDPSKWRPSAVVLADWKKSGNIPISVLNSDPNVVTFFTRVG